MKRKRLRTGVEILLSELRAKRRALDRRITKLEAEVVSRRDAIRAAARTLKALKRRAEVLQFKDNDKRFDYKNAHPGYTFVGLKDGKYVWEKIEEPK
jgi:CII-binding regulator of phage lambda lysogenization HflD